MEKIREYYDRVTSVLDDVIATQYDNIALAAEEGARAVANGGVIHTFGCSHAGIVAEESFYRAGGLIPVSPIFDRDMMLDRVPVTDTSVAEKVAGKAELILARYNIKEGDFAIIHSNSGRNTVPVEMALGFQRRGVRVAAITSVTMSSKSSPKAPCGKNLYEVADIVIDNRGVFGDALLTLDGVEDAFCASSSVTGCAIINMIIAGVIESLVAMGVEPPVFRSANIDGGYEHNARLLEKYKGRVSYL